MQPSGCHVEGYDAFSRGIGHKHSQNEVLEGDTRPIYADERDDNGAVVTEDMPLVDLTFDNGAAGAGGYCLLC